MSSRPFRFELNGMLIGEAQHETDSTGCTVFYFPNGASAVVDVRGGAAALRESESLRPGSAWNVVDAIVLAGGSTYGLEAASGVMQALMQLRHYKTDFQSIPSVPAAIVYDFANRTSASYPTKEMGLLAFQNCQPNQVSIGRAGAGMNVSVGKWFGRSYAEQSGQGAAFWERNGMKVFACSVVNALGNIFDKNGNVVLGSRHPQHQTRISINDHIFQNGTNRPDLKKENTTISIVVTNVKLDRLQLERVSVMAHSAMGRVIEPYSSPWDGDCVFVVSTNEIELNEAQPEATLGAIAGRVLQDAVLSVVPI